MKTKTVFIIVVALLLLTAGYFVGINNEVIKSTIVNHFNENVHWYKIGVRIGIAVVATVVAIVLTKNPVGSVTFLMGGTAVIFMMVLSGGLFDVYVFIEDVELRNEIMIMWTGKISMLWCIIMLFEFYISRDTYRKLRNPVDNPLAKE